MHFNYTNAQSRNIHYTKLPIYYPSAPLASLNHKEVPGKDTLVIENIYCIIRVCVTKATLSLVRRVGFMTIS